MFMIKRKDDYAIFLILSCHQCPLCVWANRSVAKEQIRASPGRENAPQHHSFDPPFPSYKPVRLSVRFLWDLLFCHLGLFSAHKCTDKNLLFSWVPCVCSASGQEKPKLGPFTQLLLNVNWSAIVYPSLNSQVFLFYVSFCFLSIS